MQAHVFICAKAAGPGEAPLCEDGLCVPHRGRAPEQELQSCRVQSHPAALGTVRTPELCVTASHAGVLAQASPAPSAVPSEQENLLGAAASCREPLGFFPLLSQEEGEEAGTCPKPHPSPPKPSFQLPPPGSRHSLGAPQLRGARSDHYLIFVPLFQQAWKQDTQERYCQQCSPPPCTVSRRVPHTTFPSSPCRSRLTPEPESK